MRERGPSAVAGETFESLTVVIGDHDACVERESLGPGAEAVGAAHDVRGGGGGGTPGGGGLGLDLREQVGAWIGVGVGVVVAGLVGDAARDAADDAIEDREEVGAGRRGQAREREAVVGSRSEDAVGDEEVEVDVEIDQAAEAPDEGDGAGLWCGEVAGARDAALPGGDGADDEAADPGGPGGVAGEPQTQRLGQGQDPLTVGRAGQDVIDEVRYRVGHAARGTRRADAAAFTREGDEDLVGAGLAADAGEAVGKEATAQVGGELAVDVAGQAATVGVAELGEQGLGVARDEFVQDGALGGAPLVAAGQRLIRRRRIYGTDPAWDAPLNILAGDL